MAKERGLTYVKLDGNVGILGNGAGLVMSTLDVVAQAGGRPGELPGRRRRLEGRGDHQRGRGDPLRPEGHGRAVQHLRRHHPLRRGRARADRGVRPDQADGAVRGSPRRDERRGGPPAAGRRRAAQRAHRVDDAGRRREGRGAGRADGDPGRLEHSACASRGSPGARGRSTACATATTGLTSSPA